MRTSDGDDGTRVRRGEGDTNESGRREEEGEVKGGESKGEGRQEKQCEGKEGGTPCRTHESKGT